jgi:xylan 1,4-beta-xylosidase
MPKAVPGQFYPILWQGELVRLSQRTPLLLSVGCVLTINFSIDIYVIKSPLPPDANFNFFPDCTRDPLCSLEVCDPSLSDKERAVSLVQAMTMEEKLDNMVNDAPGVPRLNLQAYQWWSEGLHGLAYSPGNRFAASGNYSYSTSFPQTILIGSSFDDELVREIGKVIGLESRAFMNVGRVGLDLYVSQYPLARWKYYLKELIGP